MVVPDTTWGRKLREREFGPENLRTTICDRYKVDEHHLWADGDHMRPFDVPFCNNRDRMGSRWHNWCFRCVSGYTVGFYETERESQTGYESALSF
jgi:hypothetical protein